MLKKLSNERAWRGHRAIVLVLVLVLLAACKSSEFEDIIERCSPDCVTPPETPGFTSLAAVESSFNAAIDGVVVDESVLDGRWLMFSASRAFLDEPPLLAYTDVLFTKVLMLTESAGGTSINVSDCQTTETYALSGGSFTIPANSVFLRNLEVENQGAINVSFESNILLSATWTYEAEQGGETTADVTMRKVSNDNSITTSLGQLGSDDIYCYTYLHTFTLAEQTFNGSSVEVLRQQVEQMEFKLDSSNGDNRVTLTRQNNSGTDSFSIVFDRDLTDPYQCFGSNSVDALTTEHLSFSGLLSITEPDVICEGRGQIVPSVKSFSVNAFN